MFLFFLIIFSIYTILLLLLLVSWQSIPNYKSSNHPNTTFITVIIPIRNEALHVENLLVSISNQNYPKECFEVIIVNDNSEDNSVEIIEGLVLKQKIDIKILHLDQKSNDSPKKKAINTAIKIAKGELIITTDGDCLVKKDWLNSIEQLYKEKNAKLISSPVTYYDQKNIWNAFQIIELASLVGSGASTMQLKKPTMCNGANLAYTKAVFEAVNGFEGNEHLASGDDEFLMHKIAKKYPNDIYFLKNKNAIVSTAPPESLSIFFQQRKRWASKWKYQPSIYNKMTAIFVFSVNTVWIIILVLSFIFKIEPKYLYLAVLLKSLPEILVLSFYLHFFDQSKKIIYIPFLQLIYPFYVVIFGLLSWQKGYIWKDRKLN